MTSEADYSLLNPSTRPNKVGVRIPSKLRMEAPGTSLMSAAACFSAGVHCFVFVNDLYIGPLKENAKAAGIKRDHDQEQRFPDKMEATQGGPDNPMLACQKNEQ